MNRKVGAIAQWLEFRTLTAGTEGTGFKIARTLDCKNSLYSLSKAWVPDSLQTCWGGSRQRGRGVSPTSVLPVSMHILSLTATSLIRLLARGPP